MGIENFHTFKYGNRRLADLGAVIRQQPTHVIAAPDIVLTQTPYHSGDVLVDNRRFNNVKLTVPIRAFPPYCVMSRREFAYQLSEWLYATVGTYQEYRDTYNPGYFRMGVVESIKDVVAVKRDVYETEIEFNFKPFMYSDVGNTPLVYTQTENLLDIELENPEKWASAPLIKVTGDAGIYVFDINDSDPFSVTLDSAGTFVIDKDAENVTDGNGNSINHRANGLVIPQFDAGKNEISVSRSYGTGEWTVEIIPRWRRL